MRHFWILVFMLITEALLSQLVGNFENFSLSYDSFLDGSDGAGGFNSGPIFIPNQYDSSFSSWSGWALSTMRDMDTPGFSNQYSAITGAGNNGSPTYAVSYDGFGNNNLILAEDLHGSVVAGMYVTNSTYAYLSMRDGDSFAKRFGGVTGQDPDFFKLTISGFYNGEVGEESIDVYLADYRFVDNNLDFIINDWIWVDLTSLGPVDSLAFVLSSSDNGIFGMNTPAYFCVDDVAVTVSNGYSAYTDNTLVSIWPNPFDEDIVIKNMESLISRVDVCDISGRLLISNQYNNEKAISVNLGSCASGWYIVSVYTQHNVIFKKVYKR